MRATPEFLKFTERFHQDVFDIHESAEAAVETALESLSKPEQTDLRSFLEAAIASDTSDHQLFDLWNGARSDFYLSDPGSSRDFFRRILGSFPP